MNKTRVTLIAAVVSVAAGCCLAMTTTAQATSAHPPVQLIDGNTCERTTSVVHLSPTDPTPYHIAGWLCGPRGTDRIQLLVNGFSYNDLYFMGLGVFRQLDYVHTVTESGWASLAIDQIGSGASDHPDPNALTFTTEAYVVSQLVAQLRTGHVGRDHRRFHKVVTVGHSMGGGTVLVEAGLYRDAGAQPDAVVVDDFLHATNLDWVTSVLRPHYVAANTLPAFKNLPDGYFTVQPRALFYDTDPTSHGVADPAVIARDAVVEDVGPAGMQNTLDTARDPRVSEAITVPVLLATGEQDLIGCDPTQPSTGPLSCATVQAVANREKRYFPRTRCLGIVVVPGGHDTALHPDAPALFAATNQWIAQVTGADGPAQHRPACTR